MLPAKEKQAPTEGSVGRSSNSTEQDTEVSYATEKILATIHKESGSNSHILRRVATFYL